MFITFDEDSDDEMKHPEVVVKQIQIDTFISEHGENPDNTNKYLEALRLSNKIC